MRFMLAATVAATMTIAPAAGQTGVSPDKLGGSFDTTAPLVAPPAATKPAPRRHVQHRRSSRHPAVEAAKPKPE